jgi:glycosyltransferase involved in cell wall biosynthesis
MNLKSDEKNLFKIRRLAFISNQAFSIHNFRGPLIRELTSRGIIVYTLAPDFDERSNAAIKNLGAHPIKISMSRTGLNPLRDLFDLGLLIRQLRTLDIDTTIACFIKPVIYGTIAAKLCGVQNRFAMIDGAGYVFNDGENLKYSRKILRHLVTWLYRLALNHVNRLFMMNRDDQELFVKTKMVEPQKVVLFNGTGVDLKYFNMCPPFADSLCFIMIARLLREKGVYDYVTAARIIKSKHKDVRFILLGAIDSNPGSLSISEVNGWVNEKIIEYPGQVLDVRPWIAQASVFVLPSYREGLPRSTQEAMAMGRPIITTDAIGCKETVEEGINGFKIPVRNPEALAKTMLLFIEQRDLIDKMGTASRQIAEKKFDVNQINTKILSEFGII